MTLHRIRSRMRFTASSGMAGWTKAQMDVRHDQAVHINPGLANEENKQNEIVADGDYEVYSCDLPLSDLAYAQDAYSTLTDANVLGRAVAFPGDGIDEGQPSWVEHHTCHHDENPPQPCEVVNKEYHS